jgi:tetratricopeptide (TPR) repeat protein
VDISDKVKEAETYRSMGLLEESIMIYEAILSSEKPLEKTIRTNFKSTIAEIREELESLENGEENTVSEEEIAIIRDNLPIAEGFPHILDSASAFMELGLYKEALSDYEKLLDNESTWKDILQDLATCLLKCCGPSEIFPTVKEIVARTETNDHNKSEILFRLGLEMQNRDHKALAQELCRSAKKLDPDNEEIEKWLGSNSFRQKILSKYDHLILQNKITPGQLKKALALSKKTGKSIEFILVHYFKINKVDLGKSISLFYSCAFRQYDKNILTPFELVIHLEKKSLENSHWVPISSGDGAVDVLIDDPTDLTKRDRIHNVLNNYNINFSVGIKEDIEKFIQRFFKESDIEKPYTHKEDFDVSK